MNLPSKQECERWDQAQVAVFMVKNNMPECASIIAKLKINGQRLLNLSECDISKFSLIHQQQLQRIVQDIRKNDGSLLDKFRRIKSKPLPTIPVRDYGDDDQLSDREYHNDTYEELHEDDNYEPPPSHREFSPPSASLPRGEYLDNRPSWPPKTPLRPNRASKQLPPEPIQMSDEEDYINPDANDANDDDNYIEPEEDPSSRAELHETSLYCRDTYQSVALKPDVKPREFESRTLPVMHTDQKSPPKAFTMDFKRPKIPCPQLTWPKPAERGSVAAENGSINLEKNTDTYNKPWYAAACDRRTADDVLLRSNKDGAFMVRKSSGQDAQQPYTLVVFYRGRVYNIPIRLLAGTQQYALGREKKGEEYFSSISHIIENHQRNPLVLIDAQSNTKDSTKLSYPVKP
ncbi:B-cell linker protein [Xenentodon cancila]